MQYNDSHTAQLAELMQEHRFKMYLKRVYFSKWQSATNNYDAIFYRRAYQENLIELEYLEDRLEEYLPPIELIISQIINA